MCTERVAAAASVRPALNRGGNHERYQDRTCDSHDQRFMCSPPQTSRQCSRGLPHRRTNHRNEFGSVLEPTDRLICRREHGYELGGATAAAEYEEPILIQSAAAIQPRTTFRSIRAPLR